MMIYTETFLEIDKMLLHHFSQESNPFIVCGWITAVQAMLHIGEQDCFYSNVGFTGFGINLMTSLICQLFNSLDYPKQTLPSVYFIHK